MASRACDSVTVCDWLPPDFGAVGQYADAATREEASRGAHVVLVGLTSGRASAETEMIGRGRRTTIRLRARSCHRTRLARRLAWTVETNTRLIIAAWAYMRGANGVTFTGSPPLFLHWLALANIVLRKPLTYRITDFHPECLIAARGGRAGPLLRAVLALTWFWRRRVHRFEVVGRDQIGTLIAGGIPASRIRLSRDKAPVTVRDGPAAPRPPGTRGRTLLLYSGNWGLAHDVDTVLAAYRAHHRWGSGRTLLWLNATGQRASELREVLRREGLAFVDGAPVPLDRLAPLLMAADAHLVTLAAGFEGLVLPSKIHACLDTGRPVIFVGSPRSDVHALCTEARVSGYRRVDPGDRAAMVAALEELSPLRARNRFARPHAMPERALCDGLTSPM